MKRFISFILLTTTSAFNFASSGYDYVHRFNQYLYWSEHLPQAHDPAFNQFISDNSPLGSKLRDRYLYKLALAKDWQNYIRIYRPSKDTSLQCYEQIGRFQLGFTQKAVQEGRKIWLTGQSLPPACDAMYNLFKQAHYVNDTLIHQRIMLALDNKNIKLAAYLLNQLSIPRHQDAALIEKIDQFPHWVSNLNPGLLHAEFFLYGAKKWINTDMDRAIAATLHAKARGLIHESQLQNFIAHVALYKAMRDAPDTLAWFSKVKRPYYNDTLLDWQIRYALKHYQWARVEQLIRMNRNIKTPCWQYWLARALEKRGQTKKAHEIYARVARERHYYGFLASLHINKTPSFNNERVLPNTSRLRPYQSITNEVRKLYRIRDLQKASRLLNDFVMELPKADISALAYWLSTDLKWEGKAITLGNDDRLSNQLSLRFPTPHAQTVSIFSHHYDVPREFIYAIMRQESGFRADVVSPAGAHGLMQLMPQTASHIARIKKIPYHHKNELFHSDKNINLGVAYLNQLGQRYQKHPILMAAAYNAGPGQVSKWVSQHPPEQIDIWIETIPWYETRNYIKNIVSFYAVYQYRMYGKPNLAHFMKPYHHA